MNICEEKMGFSYYDEELLAEWRSLYDPTSTIENVGSESFEKEWNDYNIKVSEWELNEYLNRY